MWQFMRLGEPGTLPPPGTDPSALLADEASTARILIVEDEIVVNFFLKALCEERGFEVACATTAEEALQVIEAQGRSLRAAIIDIGLPDTPGDQLVPHIRAALPDLPIVIATGFSATEFDRRFSADDRIGVIGKPFDGPHLWSVLGALDDDVV